MRVSYAPQQIAPANGHLEFPAHSEIKEPGEACFQALVGQQRGEREAGQRSAGSSQPRPLRH